MSEEEEMASFLRTMNDSGFTPNGSRIQFFMSAPALPDITTPFVPGIVFGVPGEAAPPLDPAEGATEGFLGQHFGALSGHGIYVSSAQDSKGDSDHSSEETKLSAPHSRIYSVEKDVTGSVFGALAVGLADAATIAVW